MIWRSLLAVMILWMGVAFSPGQEASAKVAPEVAPTLEEQLVKMAPRIPFLPLSETLYDRLESLDRGLLAQSGDLKAFVALSRGMRKDASAALPLLRHADPQVRTLALYILFDSENPAFLPAIYGLVGDQAETYTDADRPLGQRADLPPTFEFNPQTVGRVATACVEFRLKFSGFSRATDFDAFLRRHKDRKESIGWWEMRLERACMGTHPFPRERQAAADAIFEEIRRLPEPRRNWVLLWMGAVWHQSFGIQMDGQHPKTGLQIDELVAAMQKLPRTELLAFLTGEPTTSDPDMRFRENDGGRYEKVAAFILKNAAQLFTEKDAARFLAMEKANRGRTLKGNIGLVSPRWAIAAASLDRKNASSILQAALKRFPDKTEGSERAEVACALSDLAGEASRAYLVEWFYGEPSVGWSMPFPREKFLTHLAETQGQSMLRALIADDRFKGLEWSDVVYCVNAANRLSPSAGIDVAGEEARFAMTRRAEYFRNPNLAREKHPEEYARAEAFFENWRTALRGWASQPAPQGN